MVDSDPDGGNNCGRDDGGSAGGSGGFLLLLHLLPLDEDREAELERECV